MARVQDRCYERQLVIIIVDTIIEISVLSLLAQLEVILCL